MDIQIKRAYEPADPADGCRILVDRLWPRGLKKEQVACDLWLKEIAPSTDLRKWFNHEHEKWPEFQRRYRDELSASADVKELLDRAARGRLTLVYGAHDQECNQAVVLRDYLLELC
ncbi:DUF488 domain-containing protein [Nitrosomonas sp.]|uniref:DUF488 domain-containing protein n=1 Tax=Nitrosomonas sp. TaxID=42353 RepID=UPI0025CD2F3D|nr:DUF488 domain-containing protein [Nitrosomonas sp.]MCC6917502.1 DUF488 domain-containing protein [Nitrosomonas sp.]